MTSESEEPASGGYLTEAEVQQKENENLIAALRYANSRVWGPDGAAAQLGIKPSTLAYRMNSLGISRKRGTG